MRCTRGRCAPRSTSSASPPRWSVTETNTGTGPSGRPSVGVLSVPWIGVPPKGGSVSTVVHETTRRLADRFEFWIAGGATGRIPTNEVPGIEYCALGDWADRRLFDNWVALRERLARHHEHAYYRRSYHPSYARRAAAWFDRA